MLLDSDAKNNRMWKDMSDLRLKAINNQSLLGKVNTLKTRVPDMHNSISNHWVTRIIVEKKLDKAESTSRRMGGELEATRQELSRMSEESSKSQQAAGALKALQGEHTELTETFSRLQVNLEKTRNESEEKEQRLLAQSPFLAGIARSLSSDTPQNVLKNLAQDTGGACYQTPSCFLVFDDKFLHLLKNTDSEVSHPRCVPLALIHLEFGVSDWVVIQSAEIPQHLQRVQIPGSTLEEIRAACRWINLLEKKAPGTTMQSG